MAKEKEKKAPEEMPAEDAPATPTEQTAPNKADDAAQANDKADALARELAEQKDKFLRLAAEYDNYRKRTAKEKESVYADAKIETLTGMLPVYDNLERALAQFGADDDSPHRKGVEMIFTQFKESLSKLGVTPIDALGKPFDPEKHNAVMHVEDENAGENTVVEVLQQGFSLGDKILRFAIVKVAN